MKLSINFLKKFLLALCIFSTFLTVSLVFAQEVVDTITRPGFRPVDLAVYETGDKLFVRDGEEKLFVYDGTSLAFLAELSVAYRQGYSGMIINEQCGKLYATSWYPQADSITVVSTVTNELIGYIYIEDPSGYFAKDEELGRVYNIGGFPDKYLYVIDVSTDSITDFVPLSGGGLINGIGVNPVTHEVFIGYITVGCDSLDIVDGLALTCTTVTALNGHGMVVNHLENKVYRELGSFNGFWVYDRDIDSVTEFITGNDATPEVFNPTTNRVHTSSEVNGESTIIECTSDSWFNISMYSATTKLGVCYDTNHVYYVGPAHIVVLDGSTLEWLADIPNTWLENPSSYDIAINQYTGRVFVSYSDGTEASNTIVVIQDNTGSSLPNSIVNSPTEFFLSQNYPNPFNSETSIKFIIPQMEEVKIVLYNMLGEEEEILFNEIRTAGKYTIKFDCSNYPSGLYFYKMSTNRYSETKKLLILK